MYLEKAEEYLLQAKKTNEELGTREQNIEVLKSLAGLYEQQNRWEAISFYKQCFELEKKVQSEETKRQVEFYSVERNIAVMKREQEILQVKNEELAEMNNQLTSALEEIRAIQDDLIRSERNTTVINQKLSEKNEVLQQLNIEKNEFLGIAAHDLKNPLTSIVSSAQLISRYFDRLNREQMQEKLGQIEQNASYMRNIIMNLLDVNAIESGMFNIRRQKFCAGELIERITHSFDEQAESKEMIIRNEALRPTIVLGDENALTQVLENLISNAIKYAPLKTEIVVKTEKLG